MTFALSACGGGTPAPTQSAAVDTSTSSVTSASQAQTTPTQPSVAQSDLPLDAAGTPLVARVNGVDITLEVYEREFARSQQLGIAADLEALARTILDRLIEQQVIEQAAATLGIVVTEAEIDADIANMTTQAGSPEAWTQWKRDNLYTDAEYRAATRSQLLTLRVRDAVVAQFSATAVVGADGVPQVRARHILVGTEAEAQQVLTRLQNGETFEALAAELSRDVTTKDRGGDLGFFIAENLTTPELAEVAFSLQPGEIAGPVATALGYHIIQTIEFATLSASPEEQARQQESIFNTWLQAQLASAQVERYLQ
jgi:parvulin-like peptidyl-prolyl isomerase